MWLLGLHLGIPPLLSPLMLLASMPRKLIGEVLSNGLGRMHSSQMVRADSRETSEPPVVAIGSILALVLIAIAIATSIALLPL